MKLQSGQRIVVDQSYKGAHSDARNRLPQIIAETRLERWGCSHGGYRRTLQLREIVAKAGIEAMEVEAPAPASNLSYYCKGLKFLFRAGLASRCSLSLIRRHGIVVARLAHGLARHNGEKVLIWEFTHRNEQAVPFLARMFGYAIVAIPHNIEALVPTEAPLLRGLNGGQFGDEARAFRAVNSIFTISREEQWFLAFYGLPSFHLPYFPAVKIATQFFSVRARRRGVKPKRLLILGHAGYPPTRAGMEELIRILLGSPGGASLPVDVAGFETECLQPLVEQTGYCVHGSVSDARLEELVQNARAVLVHQPAGAGALTRIPEMLIAGVPVIANSIAARSYAHLDGVHVYETPAELVQLLKRAFVEPDLPERPIAAETRLVDTLRQCILLQRQAKLNTSM
ncbi:MAG: hypothetical protein JWR26_3131 [Pedosphaera sp.]|nr:hypothetical protein [Pedosphaera sp.]